MANKWRKEILVIIFLILLALIPVLDLAKPGLFVAHDSRDHVARIANFILSINEGLALPRWAANLNWGYGHPVLQFLYPLPSYMASGFNLLGWPLVDSIKLVFIVTYILSLLSMYVLIRVMFGQWAGVAAAIVYGFSPYRFVDLYVRGAIGEHVAFVFMPLVFLFIWLLAQERWENKKWWWVAGLGLSTAGLILSHNAVSLMILAAAAIFTGVNTLGSAERRRYWVLVGMGVGWGLGLAAFFWIPAFWEGKYTLRDIVTQGELVSRFVPIKELFEPKWNYGGGNQFSKEIGATIWMAIIVSIFLLKQKRRRADIWLWVFSLGLFTFSIFMTTGYSRYVWESLTILQKFQFPWRFLTVSVFSGALIAGQTVKWLGNKGQKVAVLVVLILVILNTQRMWKAKEYVIYPESYFFMPYAGTTDTGESSPIWSIRFMEKFPPAAIEVVSGEADIIEVDRSTVKHVYNIEAKSDVRLVENTLYFPGWKVLVDNIEVPVEFQNPAYRGLMTFETRQGKHRVEVSYGDTRLRKAANYLSLSMGILGLIFLMGNLWTRKIKFL